jgi:hypothetical protein
MAGDMTNPDNSLDVNDDSQVTARDALAIINYMAIQQTGAEGEQTGLASSFFPDTNGDGRVTSRDSLRVINRLGQAEQVALPVSATEQGVAAIEAAQAVGPPTVFGLIVDPGSSPRIKFSAVNLTLTVTSPSAGLLRFTSNVASPLNNQTLSITQDFTIQVIGVDNTVVFDGVRIPNDLKVEIVDGHDNVIRLVNASIADDFIYRGNGGTDSLIVDAGTVIGDDADIKTGGGNDVVSILGARVGDDFRFNSGSGNDMLNVNGGRVGDDAIIHMDSGNDFASFIDARVGDVAEIDGDSGTDRLAADVGSVTARKLRVRSFELLGSVPA